MEPDLQYVIICFGGNKLESKSCKQKIPSIYIILWPYVYLSLLFFQFKFSDLLLS